MAVEAAIASAIFSAASGAVQYVGAQRQAKAMEYNAQAVQNQAEYNAVVARNNALAEQQQVDFQSTVVQANKRKLLEDSQRELTQYRKKSKQEFAAAEVKFGYGGTFNDVLDAYEQDAFEKELSFLGEMESGLTSAFLQEEEYGRQSKLIAQQGDIRAQNILLGGRNEANNLRNQAGNVRTAGFASMLGSFAQAGSTYAASKE